MISLPKSIGAVPQTLAQALTALGPFLRDSGARFRVDGFAFSLVAKYSRAFAEPVHFSYP